MKYHTITLDNGEELNFRLTASDATFIEEKKKVKLLDLISDYSITTICYLLRFLRKGAGEGNFSDKDAQDLFDKLADNDYALEDIQTKIILPALQVSGLLTKSDLENIMNKVAEKKQATQEV